MLPLPMAIHARQASLFDEPSSTSPDVLGHLRDCIFFLLGFNLHPGMLSFSRISFPFQRELEDLAAFEMLEEAACDSSFCSSSSKVKKIIRSNANGATTSNGGGSMPSPICKPPANPSVTSTPIASGEINHYFCGSRYFCFHIHIFFF